MGLKGFKVYLCAVIFGIVKMSADVIRCAYECKFLMMVYHTVFLFYMIFLLRWSYRKDKRESMQNGTKSKSNV